MSQAAAQAAAAQAATTTAAQVTGGGAPPATASQQHGGDADLDVVSLLIEQEPTAAAPATTAENAASTGDGAAAQDEQQQAGETGTQQGESTQQQQQPPTTDPALQQMREDLAAAVEQIKALAAKPALTNQEQQQVQRAQRKIDTVRARLAENQFDPITHVGDLVDSVAETDQSVQTLQQKLDDLTQRVTILADGNRRHSDDTARAKVADQYKGVDVNAVFNKALADSAESMGLDPGRLPDSNSDLGRALNHAANRLFHQRADVAAKSIAGRTTTTPPATPGKTPATKPTPTPVTKDGARVSQPAQVVTNNGASDPDAEYVRTAHSLVQ